MCAACGPSSGKKVFEGQEEYDGLIYMIKKHASVALPDEWKKMESGHVALRAECKSTRFNKTAMGRIAQHVHPEKDFDVVVMQLLTFKGWKRWLITKVDFFASELVVLQGSKGGKKGNQGYWVVHSVKFLKSCHKNGTLLPWRPNLYAKEVHEWFDNRRKVWKTGRIERLLASTQENAL